MKTEITYSNGLNIVIEHPDLLEAVESKETVEAIAALTAENNALRFEVEKAEEISTKRLYEINALKQQVSNLEIDIMRLTNKKEPGVFEFKGTGGHSKEYVGNVGQITPMPKVIGHKKQREYRSRHCETCGNSFVPKGPRSRLCNTCKPETKLSPKHEDLPE